MPKYYILQVNDADLTDLWNNRPFTLKLSTELNFRAKIKYSGISQRTCSIKCTTTPTWNESFPLCVVLPDDSSQLVVDITVTHIAAKDINLGYSQINLCVSDRKAQVSLSSTKGGKSNTSSTICLSIQSSNAMEATSLALGNIVRDIVRLNVKNQVEGIDRIIEEGEKIFKSDLIKSCKSLSIADALISGLDQLAKVHPILELGWRVFTALYKLAQNQVKLDREIQELVEELVDFFRILVDITSSKHKVESFVQAIDEILDFIAECSIFIQVFIRRGFIERALRLSEKSVIEGYVKRFRVLKSKLKTRISVMNTSILTENTNILVDIVDVMGGNSYNIERTTQHTLLLKLESKLRPVHLSGIDRPECLRGTQMDIRRKIHDWANSTQYPNFLLLLGAAGTGKSTIATTIAREFRKKKQLGSYSFFIRGKSDPESVFTTIAYDLAEHNNLFATLIDASLTGRSSLHSATYNEQFDLLIKEPLSSAANSGFNDPILIVLDALDECGTPQERRSLIQILRIGLHSLPLNFRFLVTGRPEEDIIPLKISSTYSVVLDQNSEGSIKDVHAYVMYEFERLRDSDRLHVPIDWPWEQSMKILAFNAGGLFIWASTAVKLVAEKKTKRFMILDRLVKDAKSLNLNELYVTVLENSVDWDEEGRYNFANILSLIFFGRAPLTDNEIDSILGLERDTTEELLSGLRSLIMYEPGQPIKIHHASFYDYLVSCKGEKWYIDIEEQKIMIASRCFDRMKEELHFNMCHLESSFVRNEDVPDLGGRVKKYIPTFLQYVCCNWMYHLQDVGYSEVLHDQLKVFTKDKLLFWFEVLSLTSKFKDHVGTALVYATKWLANKDPGLLDFLRDAHRQSSVFSEPISQSMPHIYCTFLPLTKSESIVSRHYAEYANRAVQVEYIGDKWHEACIKVITNRSDRIYTVSFSPDGTHIISGSRRGEICGWNAASGKIISRYLDRRSGAVCSVTYSPNGKLIASGSEDGVSRVRDVINGELLGESKIETDRVSGADGNQEGGLFVDESGNGNGDERKNLNCVAFSPCGKIIASGNSRSTIQMWEVESRRACGKLLVGHTARVNSVSFSSDGGYLVSGSSDNTIIVWDVQSGEVRFGPFLGHKDSVDSVAFSPNGENIVSGSHDMTVRVWRVSSGDEIGSYELKGSTNCLCLSFSPDGTRFVSGHLNGAIKIWDVTGGLTNDDKLQIRSRISSISVSPSGRFIASTDSSREVCVFHSTDGSLAFDPFTAGSQVVFSPNDDMILACVSWNNVIVRTLENGNSVTLKCQSAIVSSIAFSPNGKHVASGASDGVIYVWDLKNSRLILEPLKVLSSVRSIAYSPDGRKFVSGSQDAKVHLWNAENGQLISTLRGHSDVVRSVAFSHDGLLIASGARDRTIRVWKAESGESVTTMEHNDSVQSVVFLPDGKKILSGSSDKTICIWDASNGNLLIGPLEEHTNCVTSVTSFPNGKYFASGSYDGTVRIWSLNDIYRWPRRGDGWITDKNGNLILWTPPNLRRTVCTPRSRVISRLSFFTELDFTSYVKVDEWTKISGPDE